MNIARQMNEDNVSLPSCGYSLQGGEMIEQTMKAAEIAAMAKDNNPLAIPEMVSEGSMTSASSVTNSDSTTSSNFRYGEHPQMVHITATITTQHTKTEMHFGVPLGNSDLMELIIGKILESPPVGTIHSVYKDVVNGHNVVSVYSSTDSTTGMHKEKDEPGLNVPSKPRKKWKVLKKCIKKLFSCFG